MMPLYEVWVADLNTLYDDMPHSDVFLQDCYTLDEAYKIRDETQDSVTAAWVIDKETRKIIM